MDNTELLQKVLNQTIERMAKQTAQHESEIANLVAQIIVLQEQVSEAQGQQIETKTEQ